MIGEHERELFGGESDQGESDQRRPCHVERARSVLGQRSINFLIWCTSEVDFLPRRCQRCFGPPGRHGRRRCEGRRVRRFSLPAEQRVGGAAQALRIDCAGQIESHLYEVCVDRSFGQFGVEQQPRLQWREWPDIAQVGTPTFEVVDRLLSKIDQMRSPRV